MGDEQKVSEIYKETMIYNHSKQIIHAKAWIYFSRTILSFPVLLLYP